MNARPTAPQRAQRLPAPTPGQAITIPLELLPIYLEAHRLQAMDRTTVSKLEERTGTRKESGVVWVRPIGRGPEPGAK